MNHNTPPQAIVIVNLDLTVFVTGRGGEEVQRGKGKRCREGRGRGAERGGEEVQRGEEVFFYGFCSYPVCRPKEAHVVYFYDS